MGVADSIFEPRPPYFGKILIFSRCSNDSKIIFWYFQWYQKCQKSDSLSIQLIPRSTDQPSSRVLECTSESLRSSSKLRILRKKREVCQLFSAFEFKIKGNIHCIPVCKLPIACLALLQPSTFKKKSLEPAAAQPPQRLRNGPFVY